MTKQADHQLDRLVFFSDAVFAIAITLLIIEIHPPHIAAPADLQFVAALARLIPNFVGFTVSFFVIGAFWGGHHRAFALAAGWDAKVMFPNTLMLFAIAAMPFFTAFSSSYSLHRVPVAAYCLWLTLTALCNVWLQHIVTSAPIVNDSASAAQIAFVRRRGFSVVLGGVSAFVVSLIFAPMAFATLATIPLWRRMLDWVLTPRSRR